MDIYFVFILFFLSKSRVQLLVNFCPSLNISLVLICLSWFRKMTTEDKKRLASAITRLSPEDINKAIEIIAQNDPTFRTAGETVEVDIDAQVFRHCLIAS